MRFIVDKHSGESFSKGTVFGIFDKRYNLNKVSIFKSHYFVLCARGMQNMSRSLNNGRFGGICFFWMGAQVV